MMRGKSHQDWNNTRNILNVVVPYVAGDIANDASWSDSDLILWHLNI